MKGLSNTYGQVIFSLISAIVIVGSAWLTKGENNSDTWLYITSMWAILFGAFQVYATVKVAGLSKWALAILAAAFGIILFTWWANGAENAWIFLTSVVTMIVAFFILVPRN